ncbi:MAG: TnpV protein [Oscillospiraceae bacterium]|nr:TnpV protein [Oscillospiraceae bacterium]
MSNKNFISYRNVGDYLIPNLVLPPEDASVRLGKWGMLHKDYLLKNKKVLFTTLLTQGKLYQHCAKIENQARKMFDTLVEQMKKAEGVTEQLKGENQLEWVCRVQNIEARAKEIICNKVKYSSKHYKLVSWFRFYGSA